MVWLKCRLGPVSARADHDIMEGQTLRASEKAYGGADAGGAALAERGATTKEGRKNGLTA